ncbi:glycosyl transferase [Rhodoferax sp.]|uniref:glycosyltransferase n=1 Tax=Rhodoferax sp. TaxID=50421 RepID=UPI0025E3634B|nr:glycosyl transferase [Rhodoferax sp.]
MRLVYLSPVPWATFAQRPQKFASWFHSRTDGEVLWVDPYPTRFPRLSDIGRFDSTKDPDGQVQPDWIRVIKPFSLPLEPLPGAGWANAIFWRPILDELAHFVKNHDALLVIGKPSLLALAVLHRLKDIPSVYDAMDDFPAFYKGLSRYAMAKREARLVRRVDSLWVTSTSLKQRWEGLHPSAHLVPNALDASLMPTAKIKSIEPSTQIFGYVGTIAAWFDWEWIIALAKVRSDDVIRLIGPVFTPTPIDLPGNIEFLPECHHEVALNAMRDFDVGLIPFIRNELTASVDPIKFYEYRALGLPVISTEFGEMAFRKHEVGTFISQTLHDIASLAELALCIHDIPAKANEFALRNSWEARFDATKIFH